MGIITTNGMSRRSTGLKDEKRKKLIDAAIAEFNEFGQDNASFNRIIERSGISKGTVYYYFDNKDALLTMVFEEICAQLLEAVPDLPMPDSADNFWDTLWAYHIKEFDFFTQNPALGQILLLSRSCQEFMRTGEDIIDSDGAIAWVMKRHIALFERGQQLGAVRDDLKPQTLIDIMGKVHETLCHKMFGDNLHEFKMASEPDKCEQIKRYLKLSGDLIHRLLLPVEKLSEYANTSFASFAHDSCKTTYNNS